MNNNDRNLLKDLIGESPDVFLDQINQFRELMMMYHSAIREVTTKLEILNDELSLKGERNPIQSIKSRIKTPLSIADKLRRDGKEVCVDAISDNLNDVAGIRVICPFIDDIYSVADMLIKQDDITLINVKDFIKNPKPNGYRSYHMIVEIPVFFSDHKQKMRVEIQIRTIAMDFWASLEHSLKYKKDIKNFDQIGNELYECAKVISKTDEHMMKIKNMVEIEN